MAKGSWNVLTVRLTKLFLRPEQRACIRLLLTLLAFASLPGIGRSTAAAIFSIACGGSAAILDGNVKRVLSRHNAIDGWPGKREIEQQLWQLAEAYTPQKRAADYTQAIMDLGATLCRRSKPECDRCPVSDDCKAKAMGRQSDYPGKKPRKALPVKTTHMLLIENPQGEILLEKRPSSGIWGGLWSLPELDSDGDIDDYLDATVGHSGVAEALAPMRHTFSHYHLDIQPQHIRLQREPARIMEGTRQLWYKGGQQQLGLAAPQRLFIELGFGEVVVNGARRAKAMCLDSVRGVVQSVASHHPHQLFVLVALCRSAPAKFFSLFKRSFKQNRPSNRNRMAFQIINRFNLSKNNLIG